MKVDALKAYDEATKEEEENPPTSTAHTPEEIKIITDDSLGVTSTIAMRRLAEMGLDPGRSTIVRQEDPSRDFAKHCGIGHPSRDKGSGWPPEWHHSLCNR